IEVLIVHVSVLAEVLDVRVVVRESAGRRAVGSVAVIAVAVIVVAVVAVIPLTPAVLLRLMLTVLLIAVRRIGRAAQTKQCLGAVVRNQAVTSDDTGANREIAPEILILLLAGRVGHRRRLRHHCQTECRCAQKGRSTSYSIHSYCLHRPRRRRGV